MHPIAWLVLSAALAAGPGESIAECTAGDEMPAVKGSIVDARTGAALDAVSVVVDWDDLTLNHGTLKTSHHQARTSADKTGQFSLCGLPAQSPLMLRISASGYRDFETELALPADGVLRRAFRLAEDKATAGTGLVRARVVDDTGHAMTTGHATIAGLGRHVNIDHGIISFGGLPSGTWAVDLRAIGFERAVVLLDTEDPGPEKTIRMDRAITMLDAVSVVERSMGPDRKTLNGIAMRMRTASGSLILASDLSLRNATRASDPLPAARGFRLGKDGYYARYPSCRALPSDTSPGKTGIAVYLDGTRMPAGLTTINNLVPPGDILAIEAYPEVTSAPFLWRTRDACAVVAFWTKRR